MLLLIMSILNCEVFLLANFAAQYDNNSVAQSFYQKDDGEKRCRR